MKTYLVIFFFTLVAITQAQDRYEVYAIEYGSSPTRTAIKKISPNATSNDSVTFADYFWYLKGDNGRHILVDAGFLPDTSRRTMRLKEYVRPDLALQRIHVNADEITDVIITHTHYDHIDGVDLFPKATLWMQKNDFTYFVGGAWQKGANHIGLDKGDVLKIVHANLEGRVQLIDGDSVEIIPGIRVFTGSKHTFESQHVLVTTKTERVLLASDDAWFYFNIEDLIPITLTFNPDSYAKALRRMRTLVPNADLIIPGHDSLVLSRFTPVAEGVVRIR